MDEFVDPIKASIDLRARIVSWACPHCAEDFKKTSCVSDGKYCAMQHDGNLHLDGTEVIGENLRQYCLL